MKKTLFSLMLICFAFFGVARAQQALPYTYGFENNNLATDGWTATSGAINSSGYHTGNYGFRFSYNVSTDVYLMSPILSGGTYGVTLSFWYKAYSGTYLDHFYVGYTTDENVTDPSEFTYGSMITSTTSWQEYTEALPARTVRVAIKYDADNYDDGYYLYLDDFTFTAASSCTAPTNLAIDYTEGATSATVTWRGDASSYNVDVNGTIEAVTETSYTIRNLAPATAYTVKVQADCGEEQSAWVVAGSFSTPCPTSFAIPHTYGFEDTAEMDCWTMANIPSGATGYTGLQTNTWANAALGYNFARTGNNFFFFFYYAYSEEGAPFQTLISPELSGIVNGLHVEFYYSGYNQGLETFKVGYSTTDNAVGSFTWGDEITASSSYQRFSANYPADTKYVAVQHTSDDQYYLFLDDFLFEESASCLEPTGVTASNETTTGVTIGWTAGGEESAWDIFVTDDATIVPDENTTPTVASTSTNSYTFTTELTPATIYYVYVRAICGENEASAWSSPAIFNTECEGMSLPYSNDFQSDLSVCWNIINTNTSYTAVMVSAPSSSSSNQVLMFYRGSSTGTLAAVLPEVDATYPLNGYQITFDACYANGSNGSMTAGKLGIGIMTDPTDFTTFTLIEEVDITDGFSTYGTHNVRLNTYTGNGQYIAIQDIHTQNGYVLVDNISVTALPSCLEPTNVAVAGGKNAVVTWEGEAESFDVAISTEELEDPAEAIVGNTEENEFDLSDFTTIGDNYIYVRANCGTNGTSPWVGVYLDVNYCTPNPSSHDGSGITGVTFGTGDYVVTNGDGSASLPASAPYYGDYSDMIGAVQAGVESTIAITTGTGSYPYTFVIWVDFDNSLSFEDSEIVYIGKASTGTGTLNATITVPATQATGDYRMRIYGADSYFTSFYGNGTTNWEAAHDPCAAGTWRHANDYTLRVLEAPSCMAAGNVTVAPESITSTSAVISWTNNNGAEATYTVMQGENVLTTTAVDSYELTGLTAATSYPAGTYTIISNCDETIIVNVPEFTTLCDAIVVTDSWSEGFEDGEFSICWSQDGNGTWTVGSGDYSTSTGTHTGTYNALIKHSTTGNVTKLITPVLDLTALNKPMLTFWFINRSWTGDTDGFAVYYRTASDAEWTQIDATEEAHATWTEATYMLPNPSATYQIAFEMTDSYGYGVGLDDVVVEEAAETPAITMDIIGYGENPGGYYLIASPVIEDVNAEEAGMITEEYDLYSFNQVGDQEGKQWFNYKANNFDLVHGRGYLYASESDTQITFAGTPYEGEEFDVELSYSDVENFAGYNLVGNPFNGLAFLADGRDFYTMNEAGTAIIAATSNSIEAMEGIFVIAEPNDAVLTFTTSAPATGRMALALNLTNGRDLIDRAIVRFDSERQLPKFQLFENNSKLYIAQGTKDYAVVASEGIGEMPVNFEAASNGSYTLNFSAENVSFSYLHLIDNMTGADIDLLETSSYSFDAKTSDYASRFKLVFASSNANNDSDFAFVSDGNILVNGEGTLQVIDMTGRIISTSQVNGMSSVKLNAAAGVYVLQLNDKTQKIVVK